MLRQDVEMGQPSAQWCTVTIGQNPAAPYSQLKRQATKETVKQLCSVRSAKPWDAYGLNNIDLFID